MGKKADELKEKLDKARKTALEQEQNLGNELATEKSRALARLAPNNA